MAEIEALTAADPENYRDDITGIFGKINSLYQKNGNDLSNYTLVKLARYNSRNGGNEDQARKVYEYILKERPTGEAMGLALVDLANLEAAKPEQQSQKNAKELFQRVLNEVDDPSAHEDAVLGIARIDTANGNFAEAIEGWKRYRSNPAWRKSRPEASYKFGVCLQATGKGDEAAATFVNVYSNFPGHLDWSTKAYIDAAKIIKSKGRELDALKLLREMIQRMGHLEHEGVAEGRKLFFEWRTAFMAKQGK
jgi:TolA-binding protein